MPKSMSPMQHQKLVELAELSLKLSDCLVLLGFTASEVDSLIIDQIVRESFEFGRRKGLEALSRILVDEAVTHGNVSAARLLLGRQDGAKEEIEIRSRDAWAVDRMRLIQQGFGGKCIDMSASVRAGFAEQRRLHEKFDAEERNNG
jgi:hypothetical protein